MLTDSYRRYAALIVKRRRSVAAILALLTLLLSSRLMSLQVDMDQDTWIPQSHPYVQATKALEQVFGGRNFTLIGIVPKRGDVYQPSVLAKVQRIQEAIENLPEAVRHNVLSLSARKVKDIKANEAGLVVRRVMEHVPQTPEQIAALRQAINSNPFYINSLVSPDGGAVAIIADFKVDTSKPSYAALYADIKAILDKERDQTVDIYVGGLPVDFASFEAHMMQMPLFFGAALLIIMVIQYWSFKSFQGMLLPIFTAILSVLWALGFMGLIGVHMDGLNTTTPILIMSVAAGHAIQILKRYYEEYHRLRAATPNATEQEVNREAVVESIAKVGPVMTVAGAIAAISFATLSTSEVSVARHFGVFAASGVAAALVLEMTLIPAIRAMLRPPSKKEVAAEVEHKYLDGMLTYLARRLSGGKAPLVLGAGLAAIAAIAAGATRIQVDNSLKSYSRPESEVRVHDRALNRHFGGTNTIYFLIEGKESDRMKSPEVLTAIASLQDFLTAQPHVGKTQSIVDLIKRINQAMHADAPAQSVIPSDPKLIAQYLLLYSMSGDPQDFDSYVDNDYRNAAIWVFLKTDSTNYTEQLRQKAEALIRERFPSDITVRMGGSLPQTIAGNQALTSSKSKNIAQMVLVVFVLSALILRSFVGGLFVTTPLILVVLANFGVMGWLGIPLDMGTISTAAMAIGIGADYELYLLFRFREELQRTGDVAAATLSSLLTSGKAVLYVALSIGSGYAFLLSSGFAFYSRLGAMVVATMAVSAFAAIIFLRAMTMIFKPKFIFGPTKSFSGSQPLPKSSVLR
ncbi:MMPL family transporter [Aquabacterium sp. A7-Y]|uniref:efflux RND transporter permease subunit n=1 Tax=Aquabacterium sp. A7-Y TaxID=1349605 RepID=UPI00223E436A|nr:MMPL family transporter [Aquabacterium sp. A7-Y]MCW7540996.1 MMPL family transporter [Aquabacterium sp. A7-Y]